MLPALDVEKIKKEIIDSQLWRSVFRGGVWKDTPRDRAAHIIGNVWLHLHPVKIRKRALEWTFTWGLGGISFALYLILTLTGVLLMFYYRPTIDLAYRDIKDLAFAITLGKFMRNAHRWAAQAMVLFVILHMVRVFLTGSYKKPREFNWGVGVLLLSLTLFLSFTGYLLPWDQLAIWAVTVGTNMAGATPVIGNEGPFGALVGARINNDIRFMLLGGTMVGENTLLRFYVMHCVAVPLVVGALLILHFWRIRKDTFSAAPYEPNEEKLEVWPHLVKREYIAAAATTLFIMIWSIWIDAPLEVLANPNVTSNPSKAPWYFVGLQGLLVYFDPWIAGVVIEPDHRRPDRHSLYRHQPQGRRLLRLERTALRQRALHAGDRHVVRADFHRVLLPRAELHVVLALGVLAAAEGGAAADLERVRPERRRGPAAVAGRPRGRGVPGGQHDAAQADPEGNRRSQGPTGLSRGDGPGFGGGLPGVETALLQAVYLIFFSYLISISGF